MNKIKYLFVLALIALTGCNKNLNDDVIQKGGAKKIEYLELIQAKLECMGMSRPDDSYNYSVYPGMKEWERFETVEEMIAALQIPENILKTMSTQAILQALWEYPFLNNVLHRYQYQFDFEGTFSNNNAYNVLITRQDAGANILKRLLLLNPVHSLAAQDVSKSFEILMSQTVFLTQLNNDEKKQLIDITLRNDVLRETNEGFSNSFRMTLHLLIGKTLIAANYIPFIEHMNENELLRHFFERQAYMEIEGDDIPQLIIRYAENYLNNN